jgi:hypothetical protein
MLAKLDDLDAMNTTDPDGLLEASSQDGPYTSYSWTTQAWVVVNFRGWILVFLALFLSF